MSKVLIVDDHAAFLKGLKLMVKEISEVEVVEEASSGETFLKTLEIVNPDLVFMDIRMSGISGLEASRTALKINPELKIIILTMYGEFKYLEEAMATGVRGFLLKPPTLQQIKDAYSSVISGGVYFPEFAKNHV